MTRSNKAEPGLTDSPAYAALFELISDDGRPSLYKLAAARRALDALTVRLVADERANRSTWEHIGDQLGMTRQGAQQMHDRATRNLRNGKTHA